MSTSYHKLPPPLRETLRKALQPGEAVVWAGTPDWRAKRGELAVTFLFAAFWSGLTGTFFVMVSAAALGLVPFHMNGRIASQWWAGGFLVFLVPFVAIGLGLLWHVVRELRSGSRRVHAVTGNRLLTVELGHAKPVEDHQLSAVNFVRATERNDGSGNLTIAIGVERDAEGSPRPVTLNWAGIPDLAFVQATLDRRSTSAATSFLRAPEQRALPAALARLPAPLARAAERETRGERIDWIGRPDALYAAKWAMLTWIVALPWLWFSLRLEMTGIAFLIDALTVGRTHTPLGIAVLTALFGLPFVWVGLRLLAVPAWVYRTAEATAHIVTDRRIVTIRRRRSEIIVAAIEPSRIVSVSRMEVHGRGNIGIVLGKTTDSDGDVTDLKETLWLVEDATRAEALIEELRTRSGRRAA